MTTKTIQELEEMRQKRNITNTTLAICIGCSSSTWRNAVQRENASQAMKNNVVKVFKYYDEHHIVPEPYEIDLEETPNFGKT